MFFLCMHGCTYGLFKKKEKSPLSYTLMVVVSRLYLSFMVPCLDY